MFSDLTNQTIENAVRSKKRRFLVCAFLKRADYSHGFSSVFFFDTPEVTKIVLPKVLQNFKKTPNCTLWPKEQNQKVFQRNIQYRTRPKGSPFIFFGSFATEWILKNPKGYPFSFFRHCETFFNFFVKGSPIHQYFDILKSFCYF